MSDEIRRNMALFPIGIVTKLTELTPRQIRYYEEQGLIHPQRTKGNQRLFSLNDIDRLLEIKSLIDQGLNIAGIKQVFSLKHNEDRKPARNVPSREKRKTAAELSDEELHKLLRQQLFSEDRTRQPSLIQGELSRFFH